MAEPFKNEIIIDKGNYDENYAGMIESIINARRNNIRDGNNTYEARKPFKNKIIINESMYDPRFTDTLKKTIKNPISTQNKDIRYLTSGKIYQKSDDKYIKTLQKYNLQSGIIDPNAGGPIDPKSIFNTGLLNVKGYTSGSGSESIAVGYDGYIHCKTKGRERIVYLSSAPSDISDNVQVNTASDSPIGASKDYNFFTGVGSRVVSFSFDVFADYLPPDFSNVIQYCTVLKQMNYPTYSSALVNSPCVYFVYGGLQIEGIPTITVTYGNTIKKGKIDKAKVSVSITETTPIVNGTINDAK